MLEHENHLQIANSLQKKPCFFKVIPDVLGRSVNFNIREIYIRTARVAVSYDYDHIVIFQKVAFFEKFPFNQRCFLKVLGKCWKMSSKSYLWSFFIANCKLLNYSPRPYLACFQNSGKIPVITCNLEFLFTGAGTNRFSTE